jgi:biotin synthase
MTCLKRETALPSAAGKGGLDFNPFDVMEPRPTGEIPSDMKNGGRVKANNVAPQGVYRPDYRILTPNMRSPEYVQMSTAAAITLGVVNGKMHRCGCTRCLNLLLTYPEGCRANCAYCGLARHREAERDYADRNFIRVDWPAVPMDEVVDIIARDVSGSPFHRMCISMITHRPFSHSGVDPVQPHHDEQSRRAAPEGPGL